ncbi:MAG: homocysteine S-methyltransferase family protein [Candidatus Heimdallarchaeota archaeon]|nr:homocysteine S-methyltransferase family protein [Candidatus Heimdallarchaeota archaeon]
MIISVAVMIPLLDGPMGTELHRRGSDTTLPLWSARALIEDPDLILSIYHDYILAGARIITTNTFRTQRYTFDKVGIEDQSVKLTKRALGLALKAVEGTDVKIAGSIAPIEDCYSPDLRPDDEILKREFNQMSAILADGVDYFLIETQNSIHEAKLAVEACSRHNIPIWLFFTCDDSGSILSGDSWEDVISMFKEKVEIIGVNCSSLIGSDKAIQQIITLGMRNWGVYPNFGSIDPIHGWKSEVGADHLRYLRRWKALQPALIGTCCGATPKETENVNIILRRT